MANTETLQRKPSLWRKIFHTSPPKKDDGGYGENRDFYKSFSSGRSRNKQRTTSSEITLSDHKQKYDTAGDDADSSTGILEAYKRQGERYWDSPFRPLTAKGSSSLLDEGLPSDPTERAAMRAREICFEEEFKDRLAKRGFTKVNGKLVRGRHLALEEEMRRLANEHGFKDFGRYSAALKAPTPIETPAWESKSEHELTALERAQRLKHVEDLREQEIAQGYTRVVWY